MNLQLIYIITDFNKSYIQVNAVFLSSSLSWVDFGYSLIVKEEKQSKGFRLTRIDFYCLKVQYQRMIRTEN